MTLPSVLWRCLLGSRKGLPPVEKLSVVLLLVVIWLELVESVALCTFQSSGCRNRYIRRMSFCSKPRVVWPSGTGLWRLSWKPAIKQVLSVFLLLLLLLLFVAMSYVNVLVNVQSWNKLQNRSLLLPSLRWNTSTTNIWERKRWSDVTPLSGP